LQVLEQTGRSYNKTHGYIGFAAKIAFQALRNRKIQGKKSDEGGITLGTGYRKNRKRLLGKLKNPMIYFKSPKRDKQKGDPVFFAYHLLFNCILLF